MGCGASISSAGSPSSTPLYDSIADESKAVKAAGANGAGAGGARPSPGGGQAQRAGNQHAGVPPRPASRDGRGGAVNSRHASMDAAGASSSAAAAAGVAGAVGAASQAAAAAAPHAAHPAVLQLQVANLSGSSATMGSSSASTPQPILSDSPAVHARTAQHARGSLLKPVASPAAAAALTAAAAAAAATAPAPAAVPTGDLQASSSSSHADSDSGGVLTASGVLVASLPVGLPAFQRTPGAAAPAAAADADATLAAAPAAVAPAAAPVSVAGVAGAAAAGAGAAAPRPSQDAATNTSLSLTQASPSPHTTQQQRLQLPTTPGTPPAPPDTPSSLSGTFRSDADDAEDPAAESLRASARVQLRPLPVLAPGAGAGAAGRYGSNQTDDDEGETPAARKPRFDLAQWRSFYVFNKQNHTLLLDHLWRRFDPESHCILAATYRGQDNITVAYQGENIIHGYSCRLEGCGVDMFCLLHTLASTSNTATAGSFKVLGVFIIPGHDIPDGLSNTLDQEHFQLLRADTNDPLVRQFVGQLLTSTSPVPDYRITSSRMV